MICKKCKNEFEHNPISKEFCSKKCRLQYSSIMSYNKNRDKRLAYIKTDEVKNRQKLLKKTDKYKLVRNKNLKRRRNEDLYFKLFQNVKDRMRKDTITMFQNVSFSKENLENYLGYTIKDLEKYLFTDDKIIKSYLNKELELDHIIPYNRYFMLNPGDEEFRKCWNFKNLRLISGLDNKERKKKNFPWEEVLQYNLQDLLPKGPDKIWEEQLKFKYHK